MKPAEGGCRQKPFTPFFFSLTEGFALPVLWKGDIEEAVEESTLEKAMRYTEAAFVESGHREMKFGELVKGIMRQARFDSCQGLSERSVQNYVKEMTTKKFLTKLVRGMYALTQFISDNQTEISYPDNDDDDEQMEK